MKKLITTICLLGLVVLTMSGCNLPLLPGMSGSSYCKDEEILSKLKNDDSPEFVLDGEYYSLPASAEDFIKNGWSMTIDDYKDQEITLQPKERIEATLKKDGHEISISLANDSEQALKAEKCNVFGVDVFIYGNDSSDFFVTKYGITLATSKQDAKAVLKDKKGFSEASENYSLSIAKDLSKIDILYFSKTDYSTFIKVFCAEEWEYSAYKPLEQKEKEQAEKVAAYKKSAEKNCPESYDEIVKKLTKDSPESSEFYSIDATITAKTTGKYESNESDLLDLDDLSLFVLKDKSEQIYCINNGFSDNDLTKIEELEELKEGDVISVWGFSTEITTFADGVQAPNVVPEIIEKDGEIIYLSENLQVN